MLEDCSELRIQCSFCGVEEKRQDFEEKHRCYQAFCGVKEEGIDFYFTNSRIANINDKKIKQTLQSLKCIVCKNLIRQAKRCKICMNNICSKCIGVVDVANSSPCPSCDENNPVYYNVALPLKNLLSNIRINCISCKISYPYEKIDEHELTCMKCVKCKINRPAG